MPKPQRRKRQTTPRTPAREGGPVTRGAIVPERVLDHVDDGVLILDARQDLTFLNRAARSRLGIDDGAVVVGTSLAGLLTAEGREILLGTAVPATVRDGEWRGELSWRAGQSGGVARWTVVLTAVADGFVLVVHGARASRTNLPSQRHEEFLGLSQEAGHVGSWEWNLATGEVLWSPEMYRLHGRDPGTFQPTLQSALACYHPDDRPQLEANIPRVLRAGRILPKDVRVVLPDGEVRIHWVKGWIQRDANDQPTRMFGVNVDITEVRAASAALERENRFRCAVIENAGNGICVFHVHPGSANLGFTVWNSQMVEITGHTIEQINAPGALATLLPTAAARERAAERRPRLQAGDDLRDEEWELVRRDGACRLVRITTCHITLPDDVAGVLAVVHDITAAKRAEQELAVRARQQAIVARLGLEALIAPDADVLLREALPIVAATLHVKYVAVFVAQADGRTMILRAGAGFPAADGGPVVVEADPAALAGFTLLAVEPVVFADLESETRFRVPELYTSNGVVSGAATAISGRDRPWGVLGVGATERRDFSRDDVVFLRAVANLLAQAVERDHTEQALRASEERYRTLVDDARDAIFGLAPDRTVRWANRAAEAITGFSRADWVGRSFTHLMHPEDVPHTVDLLRGLLQGERPPPFEIRLRRRAGGYSTLEFSVTAQAMEGRIVTITGIGRDVTARLQLESQLRQSQKLQSIGQLAGGVAHDFNNVLQAITGFATIAMRPGIDETARNELIEEILAATMRGGDISRQLLTFSRQQPLRMIDADLGRLLRSLLKMLRRLIGENIELRLDCDDELHNVRCDRAQIEQVVMNLCVNARDAMPKGGHLAIEARNRTVDDRFVATHPWARAGKFVELIVTDTGCGMDERTRERIFDPFFTTKPTGQGTGLGLAVVYGIVQEHNGLIHVDSEPGRGSEFHIFLPHVERSEDAVSPLASTATAGGTETILLAEDEPAVRRMVERVLHTAGYRLLVACDGSEALDLFNRRGAEIDLVVLDAVMPKLGGLEAYRRMVEQRPGLRALFCSGYSEELAIAGARLPENAVLLQKPYGMDELLATVRRLLRSRKAGDEPTQSPSSSAATP